MEILNNIPTDWKKTKMKYIGYLYGGLSGKSGDDFYDTEHPLSKPYINFKNIAKNSQIDKNIFDVVKINPDEKQNLVKKNDLFFLMSSENYDDIGKSAVLLDDVDELYLNSFCKGFRITSSDIDARFLNYLLSGDEYRKLLSIEANGYTRINLQIGKINEFIFYYPESLEQQTKIADFLDHKTAQIDTIIEKKQKLLQLLDEKKKSIINEAVTGKKVWNGNAWSEPAQVKDSGIEWIGDIPESWEVKKLKYLVEYIESGCSVNAEDSPVESIYELGVLKTSCVYNYYFDYSENKKIFIEEYDRVKCPVKQNTIVVSRMNTPELVGASGFVSKNYPNLFLPDRLWQLNFRESHENIVEYISIILSSELYRRLYSRIATGSSPSMKNISQESYLDIEIILPTPPECLQILDYIKGKIEESKIVSEKLIYQINLLKEYRQSIISEAVTGKLKI